MFSVEPVVLAKSAQGGYVQIQPIIVRRSTWDGIARFFKSPTVESFLRQSKKQIEPIIDEN